MLKLEVIGCPELWGKKLAARSCDEGFSTFMFDASSVTSLSATRT